MKLSRIAFATLLTLTCGVFSAHASTSQNEAANLSADQVIVNGETEKISCDANERKVLMRAIEIELIEVEKKLGEITKKNLESFLDRPLNEGLNITRTRKQEEIQRLKADIETQKNLMEKNLREMEQVYTVIEMIESKPTKIFFYPLLIKLKRQIEDWRIQPSSATPHTSNGVLY